MTYTATDLRKNIYKILDRVAESGETVEIERGGKLLRITAAERLDPLALIKPMKDLIVGDAASLEHVDWSAEWKP